MGPNQAAREAAGQDPFASPKALHVALCRDPLRPDSAHGEHEGANAELEASRASKVCAACGVSRRERSGSPKCGCATALRLSGEGTVKRDYGRRS